jgi:hypothetical protein
VCDGIDLKIEIASSASLRQDIFNEYIDEILIPAVISDRGLPGCNHKPAVLFCDDCCAHCSNAALDKMARNGIRVITYPPQTSHIFQALDVLLFGILKRANKYQRRDDMLGQGVDHVLRLFLAYDQATASTTIRASWLQTGFNHGNRNEARSLIVNEPKIRQATAFREVWEFDCHPTTLSLQRMSETWGWINEHLFRKMER